VHERKKLTSRDENLAKFERVRTKITLSYFVRP